MELILNKKDLPQVAFKGYDLYGVKKLISLPEDLKNYQMEMLGKDVRYYLGKYICNETQDRICDFVDRQYTVGWWGFDNFKGFLLLKRYIDKKVFIVKKIKDEGDKYILTLKEFKSKIY